MKTAITILSFILAIFMIEAGIKKISTSKTDTEMTISKIDKYNLEKHEEIIQKILFISGMKQTNYLWELIGLFEILFGFMLLLQKTRLLGAILLLPISLNILLFHVFLEPNEIESLIVVILLFTINIFLLINKMNKLKVLIS